MESLVLGKARLERERRLKSLLILLLLACLRVQVLRLVAVDAGQDTGQRLLLLLRVRLILKVCPVRVVAGPESTPGREGVPECCDRVRLALLKLRLSRQPGRGVLTCEGGSGRVDILLQHLDCLR
jgi:hypothetical protein